MEIGLFQLENLVIARSPFLFFDLREGEIDPLPSSLERNLLLAKRLPAVELEPYLKQEKITPDRAMVLLCEDGMKSRVLARRLETAGFQNVYVVTGGTFGLLSELTDADLSSSTK
ncbi:MAG TPA: rhodanese-like domain-containing protein [Bdellovibrionales bacterium]|nr:rhodanese-like domain-containing protein [Bdellovibrionales bacterium]